jgi:hypothetical protein
MQKPHPNADYALLVVDLTVNPCAQYGMFWRGR